jgi:hypothetical protein
VRKVEKDHIVIDEGKSERSASASRSRQGTRRPSGPRSKR